MRDGPSDANQVRILDALLGIFFFPILMFIYASRRRLFTVYVAT